MDAEMTELKERLAILEATHVHLLQQNKTCYENFLAERGRTKQTKFLWMLVVADILIHLLW